jgi:alkanesulfonate monooxygenase SsuD/methylene tetrahydromethanopterin reductase-like flavin-dependent oxidoreductase (luciferase family)
LTGEPVTHHGVHFSVENMALAPRPLQVPRIPIWLGFKTTADRPVRRAARFDGIHPHELSPAQIKDVIRRIEEQRGGLDGFDVAATVTPRIPADLLADIGATWAIYGLWTDATPARALQLIESGHY